MSSSTPLFANAALPAPTGLANLTNTCFMNAGVQLVWRALLDELLTETRADYGVAKRSQSSSVAEERIEALRQQRREMDGGGGGSAKRSTKAKHIRFADEAADSDDGGGDSNKKQKTTTLSKKDQRALRKTFEAAAKSVGDAPLTAPTEGKEGADAETVAEDTPSGDSEGIVTAAGVTNGNTNQGVSIAAFDTLREELRARMSLHLSEVGSSSADPTAVAGDPSAVPTKESAALALLSYLFLGDAAPSTSSSTNSYASKSHAYRACRDALSSLKEKLAEQNERFMDWDQHDAHELTQSLLAVLHAELNRGSASAAVSNSKKKGGCATSTNGYETMADVGRNESEDDAAARWLRHSLQRDNSLITDMFNFATRTVTICGPCGNKSYNFDTIGELQLNLMEEEGEAVTAAAERRREAARQRLAGIDAVAPSTAHSRAAMEEEKDEEEAAADADDAEGADGLADEAAEDYDDGSDADENKKKHDGGHISGSDDDDSDVSDNEAVASNKKKAPAAAPAAAAAEAAAAPAGKRLSAKQAKAKAKADAKAAKQAAKEEKRAKRGAKNASSVADASPMAAISRKAAAKAAAAAIASKKSSKSASYGGMGRGGGYGYGAWRSHVGACVSLADLIESQLETEETIEGYKCDKCRQVGECTKRTSIISYPRYFLCALTRFTPDGRKIKTPVGFPAPADEGADIERGVNADDDDNSDDDGSVSYVCPQRQGACYVDLALPRPLLRPRPQLSSTSHGDADVDSSLMMGTPTVSSCNGASSSDAAAFSDPSRVNRYEVVATVCHSGNTLSFGHYTARVGRAIPSAAAASPSPLLAVGVAGTRDVTRSECEGTASGGDSDYYYAGEWYGCDDDDVEKGDTASLLPTARQGGDGSAYLVLLKAVGNTYGRGRVPSLLGSRQGTKGPRGEQASKL